MKRTTLDHYGPEYLKPEQLLEVLISPGYRGKTPAEIAANLLQTFGDLKDVVTASIHQLTKVKGIGFVKACQIKAAFELSKRIASYCEEEHPVIASIDDVVKLLAPHMMYLKQEEFRVLLLDSRKRLINHQRVSLGSLNESLVEPREVFRPALSSGAKYVILVHNHPSRDPEPSEQDILLTQQFCAWLNTGD
ncbi:MAG: DNA repair protein RadC [Theionarchaea archaeon]|nr:DNA repair protein RadC [Theionarchaea archaeon]